MKPANRPRENPDKVIPPVFFDRTDPTRRRLRRWEEQASKAQGNDRTEQGTRPNCQKGRVLLFSPDLVVRDLYYVLPTGGGMIVGGRKTRATGPDAEAPLRI